MSEQNQQQDWENNNRREEEPERVQIPHFYSNQNERPPKSPRMGDGHDSTALVFGILSVVLSSCFAPLAIAFSVLAFVWLKKYNAAGGDRRGGLAVAAAILSGLGILFSVLSIALVVLSVVNGDLNSIYGLFQNDYSDFASDPTKA